MTKQTAFGKGQVESFLEHGDKFESAHFPQTTMAQPAGSLSVQGVNPCVFLRCARNIGRRSRRPPSSSLPPSLRLTRLPLLPHDTLSRPASSPALPRSRPLATRRRALPPPPPPPPPPPLAALCSRRPTARVRNSPLLLLLQDQARGEEVRRRPAEHAQARRQRGAGVGDARGEGQVPLQERQGESHGAPRPARRPADRRHARALTAARPHRPPLCAGRLRALGRRLRRHDLGPRVPQRA